jgi:hypothetical protein
VEHLGEYKKASGSVSSPVPGHGVNHPYGVRNSGYAAGFRTGEDRAAPTGSRVVAVKALVEEDALLVLEAGKPVGILTRQDLLTDIN